MTATLSSPSITPSHSKSLEEELENLQVKERNDREEIYKQGPITDDDLERFRREWKDEVTKKRDGGGEVRISGKGSGEVIRVAQESKRTEGKEKLETRPPKTIEPIIPSPTRNSERLLPVSPRRPLISDFDDESLAGPSKVQLVAPTLKTSSIPSRAPLIKDKDRAIQLYARAVESEQSGKLNDALMMYRKAFKLDDRVDRLYAKYQASITDDTQFAREEAESSFPTSIDLVSASIPVDEPYSFQRHIQLQPDYERFVQPSGLISQTSQDKSTISRQSPLTTLLQSLPVPPSDLQFIPADENLPLPLAKLPGELIDPILSHLDVANIERFGSTCWRARYLTASSRVWKNIAEGIYGSPAILPEGRDVRDLVARHSGEWRTAVIEEERVRMDGCYISVCHYIRPGAGEQWVTITHMITYHRYLRFYPDGSVISFLTTDHPSEVVPLLRPNLRAKGLHFGRWRLVRSDEPEPPLQTTGMDSIGSPPQKTEIKGKKDTLKRRAKIVITELLEPGSHTPKYEFEMELGLRETGRGRWNKLDLANYQSINLSTGESLALTLQHQKPFYFSKVKSYNPPF